MYRRVSGKKRKKIPRKGLALGLGLVSRIFFPGGGFLELYRRCRSGVCIIDFAVSIVGLNN